MSAIQEVERDFGTQVAAIVTLGDVVTYLEEKLEEKVANQPELAENLASIKTYRLNYGI